MQINNLKIGELFTLPSDIFYERRLGLHDCETGKEYGNWLRGLSVSDDKAYPSRKSLGKIISAELMSRDSDILYFGSRQVFVRSLLAQPTRQGMHAIAVSTIFYNSRTFVSGLRILYEGTDTPNADHASPSLGYIAKDSEILLRLPDPNHFDGYELATCVNGVVGLRILSKDGFHSSWAGDIGKGEPEVAFGTFSIGHKIHPFNITCEFDSFKIVSFAITHLETPVSNDIAYNGKGLVPQPLWTPWYPREESLVQMPKMPNYQTFSPILNIDFGGSQGERLQTLTRITVHMNEPTVAFVGFAFQYDGYDALLFGRQGRMEVSFLIDGSNGEKISEVTFEQVSASLGIRSLYICTNFGNSATFMPDELREDIHRGVSSNSPDTAPGPAETEPAESNYTKQTMRALDGQVITGFTSVLEAESGSFQTFGLQCLAEPNMPTVHKQCATNGKDSYAAELCSSTGAQLIRRASAGCQAYTYASLENVRSIRISRGSMGRPRGLNEISGLRFDYYFDKPSKIVGQWISEVERMDFIPGERIVEISICISRLAFNVSEKTHVGRVVSISILTSEQLKTVRGAQLKDDCTKCDFRENRLEKLSSIVWAFNSGGDHPRVLSSPTTEGIRLWDPTDCANLLPGLVPDKVLWEEQGGDRVRSITVYRSPYGQTHHITRMAFTYDSGLSRNIGHVQGEPSSEETHSIIPGEDIIGIDWLSGWNGILLKITLHLERSVVENSQHARRSHTFDGGQEVSRKHPGSFLCSIELSASRWTNYVVEGHSQRAIMVGELPSGEAVGLWGFNRDSGGILGLGVIFLREETPCEDRG
ncbi:hypothetical protein FQN54_002096 [Arachnomyces sp. PD_36]|nr:hypothetical protein FQN54_002096 [Arachnomyces sp. PD_36]